MAVDGDDVDDDDDRDMFLLSLLLFWNAALQPGPCDLPLVWVHVRVVQACGCNGLWPLIVIHHRVSVSYNVCTYRGMRLSLLFGKDQRPSQAREPVLPNDFPEIPCSLIETHFCPFPAVHPLQVLP